MKSIKLKDMVENFTLAYEVDVEKQRSIHVFRKSGFEYSKKTEYYVYLKVSN